MTGASTRRGALESARDQPRQPRMGAQRLADQIGTGGAQPFLKQAIGQQIGGDRDATRALAARAGSRVLYGLVHMRIAGGHKSQVHR